MQITVVCGKRYCSGRNPVAADGFIVLSPLDDKLFATLCVASNKKPAFRAPVAAEKPFEAAAVEMKVAPFAGRIPSRQRFSIAAMFSSHYRQKQQRKKTSGYRARLYWQFKLVWPAGVSAALSLPTNSPVHALPLATADLSYRGHTLIVSG